MTEHNLFYYPYASFTNAQLPLLKVAALYFDKLVILDPVEASWDTIGADKVACDAVMLLKKENILEVVRPADILSTYSKPITEAIRRDLSDSEFLKLCEDQSQATGKQRWTLSLAKVPEKLMTDKTMHDLMGDFAREVARDAGDFIEKKGENPALLREFTATGQTFVETREGYDANIEFRYADFPLPLGESIMINHAIFSGLLHAGCIPLTDDLFHSKVLELKLQRARQIPEVAEFLDDPNQQESLKQSLLLKSMLDEKKLNLPIIPPAAPLEKILEYRKDHESELQKARETLSWLAQQIEATPFTKEFATELRRKAIPDVHDKLEECRKTRDSWLKSKKYLGLDAAAVAISTVALIINPATLPVFLLTVASSSAIPGVSLWQRWKDGKKETTSNGLHYFLDFKVGNK